MEIKLYPWQQAQFEYLKNLENQNKLPHALLISGENNQELNFAKRFVQFLLCAKICGQCQNCRWFQTGAHPDYFALIAEDDSSIKVDEIRELTAWLDTRPQTKYKIALIAPAQLMTTAAANSLLKKLEEPVGNKIIILVSQQSKNLLATIRSRCQEIHLPPPKAEEAENWWQMQDLNTTWVQSEFFKEDPLLTAAWLQDETTENYLQALKQFLQTADNFKQLADYAEKMEIEPLLNISWFSIQLQLKNLAKQQRIDAMQPYLELMNFITECKANLNQSANLNAELLRENFLMRLRRFSALVK